jgi:Protein of unknown function (DUF2997)
MKTIIVTIENGTAKVETKGFVGKACIDAAAPVKQAMGVVTETTHTPEYHQKEVRTIGH